MLKIFIVAFSIYCNISAAAVSAKKRHRRKFAKSSEKLTKIYAHNILAVILLVDKNEEIAVTTKSTYIKEWNTTERTIRNLKYIGPGDRDDAALVSRLQFVEFCPQHCDLLGQRLSVS